MKSQLKGVETEAGSNWSFLADYWFYLDSFWFSPWWRIWKRLNNALRKFSYFVNIKLLRIGANRKMAGPESWMDNKRPGEIQCRWWYRMHRRKSTIPDSHVNDNPYHWADHYHSEVVSSNWNRNRNMIYNYINVIGSSMKTPAQYFAMLKNLKFRHYWVINREQNETIVMLWFIWIINIMCSRVISCGSLE